MGVSFFFSHGLSILVLVLAVSQEDKPRQDLFWPYYTGTSIGEQSVTAVKPRSPIIAYKTGNLLRNSEAGRGWISYFKNVSILH